MNKLVHFLKKNIYYMALGLGVIALTASVIIYNSRLSNELEQGQLVDLNGSKSITEDEQTTVIYTEESEGFTEEITTEEVQEEDEIKTETESTKVKEKVKEENAQVVEKLTFSENSKLSWPVIGDVVLPYSMDTTIYFETLDEYKCNPAILIQAPDETNVSCAYKGEVIDIIEDDELGNKVIMNIGNDYQITYAQLKDVCVNVGDIVEKYEVIGKVAKPTRFFTLEGTHLYFKVTKDDEPVNPMTLLENE